VSGDVTGVFADAVREAEALIANPPFPVSEQDLAEGYDYLAGSIRSSLQMAFDYDLEHPVLINPTHQYARQGLDNPDAIYFNAYLKEGVEYVVRGRRGSSADLSFQVMSGSYSADSAAGSMLAFDDRELEKDADGNFEFRYVAEPGAKTMIVREVYNDWDTEERGRIWIERTDTVGTDRGAVVARITAAALRNDFSEARRELKTLSPEDRAAVQGWLDRADARDAALAASRQFATEAMAALAKPSE